MEVEPASPGQLTAQLRRERLLDMQARLSPVRRRAFGVLALALIASGPWFGYWFLIPLVIAAAAFGYTDRRMARSAHPERWMAAGWAVAPAMIAVSIAQTGAADSPATGWLALPAVTLGARFELRGTLCGVAYTVALMLLVTVGLEPGTVLDQPDHLFFPLAIVIAVTILSAAVVQSDRDHRHGAMVDPLTGSPNRAALTQRFAELAEQARQGAGTAGVAFLIGDIDHFKRVNDEFGHAMGDTVLRAVAEAMRATLPSDFVYRIGGEEFVVLLPGADGPLAAATAERLRAAVGRLGSPLPGVTMSFGVAVSDGRGLDFDRLFVRADAALYAAKRSGRDRVSCADGALAGVAAV
jgi:diguanylate cyclase (GGDEF)-like protein